MIEQKATGHGFEKLSVEKKRLIAKVQKDLDVGMELYQTKINGKRYYIMPENEGNPLVSVTSVVRDVIDKPLLVNWGKRVGLEAGEAVIRRHIGRVIDCELVDSFMSKSRSELKTTSTAAANFGTRSHQIIESLIKGEAPIIPLEYQTVVDGFNLWRDKYDTHIIGVESPVFSTTLGIGGTIDALGFQDSGLVLVDWKTSKGFYPEYALQAGGYICCLEEMLDYSISSAWVIRFGKERPELDVRAVNVDMAKSAFIRAKGFWDAMFLSELWVGQ